MSPYLHADTRLNSLDHNHYITLKATPSPILAYPKRPDHQDMPHAITEALGAAKKALDERAFQQCLISLDTINNPLKLTAPLIQEYLELRARAHLGLGNYFESAQDRIRLNAFLAADSQSQNNLIIWQTLLKLRPSALYLLQPAPPPNELSGWMALAAIQQEYGSKQALLRLKLSEWEKQYPRHPARSALPASLSNKLEYEFFSANKIALLLPFEGAFAKTSQSILQGFMASYYEHLSGHQYQVPNIKIYQSDQGTPIQVVYQKAISDGSDIIVGPLIKEQVKALAEQMDVSIPTISLNYLSDNVLVKNLIQFGLSPENEAQEVARFAYERGHQNALVIAPKSPWGNRIVTAFSQEWRQLGGAVKSLYQYTPKDNLSHALRQHLGIAKSQNRANAIKQIINDDLQYRPTRRDDIDFVFLAALPGMARQIKPLFAYHFADDLPIYATSHLISGHPHGIESDLSGIIFCDIPWIASNPEASSFKHRYRGLPNQLPRFFALGYDAYNLIPHMSAIRNGSFRSYDGLTGSLSISERNQVYRSLSCAMINQGHIKEIK